METTAAEKKNVFDRVIRGAFFLLVVSVPLYFSLDLTTYTLPKVVLAQVLACILLAAWFLRMTLEGRYVFKPAALKLEQKTRERVAATNLLLEAIALVRLGRSPGMIAESLEVLSEQTKSHGESDVE